MSILAGILVSICGAIPVAILTELFSHKNIIVKIIGYVIYLLIFLLSFYIMIVNAAIMGVEESNSWAYSYFISFIVDTFALEIFGGFFKL